MRATDWETLTLDDAYDPDDDSDGGMGLSPEGIRDKAGLRKIADALVVEIRRIALESPYPFLSSPPSVEDNELPDTPIVLLLPVSDDVSLTDLAWNVKYGLVNIDLAPYMERARLTRRSCIAEDVGFVVGCEVAKAGLYDPAFVTEWIDDGLME